MTMASFRRICVFTGMAITGFAGQGALAETAPASFSREVVQPLPPASAGDLSAALRRIASNPRDGQALIQAGWASLRLNDISAAVGFFTRAEAVGSVTPEARAGLAATQIHLKRPVEAVQMFEEAERLGLARDAYASDRGLAYDLVGDNVRAQEFYRIALASGKDEDVTRRLALSQAIAGDQAASEATLLPLLQRRDLAAYRTRAFSLAALGKTEEAVSIADAVMPPALASRIAPYLRYMPRLTRAQQAAAAAFGHFPEAAAIGRDDPRIAAMAQAAKPVPPPPAALDARLVPAGAPLGETPKSAGNTLAVSPAAAAAIALAQNNNTQELAPVQAPPSAATRQDPLWQAPLPPASQSSVTAPSLAVNQPAATQPAITQPASTQPAAAAPSANIAAPPPSPPVMAAAELPAPPPPASLADAFADFSLLPDKVSPPSGAVDITAITPRREVVKKPEPPAAKPAPPAHPSRIWVQVATGRDRSALAFDWRRFTRTASKQFADRKAYVAKWGQTNRLLTGPFENRSEANGYVNTLKAAGIDSFMFTSAEGEAVDPLSGG